MTVSLMTREDVKAVALLEKECFASPWTEQTLIEETENPTAVFLVAKENDEIIGYIGSNNILGEVFITNIAVTSSFRRKGVGFLLLKSLIDECGNKRASYLTLEVRKSNISAIKLYEKAGFKQVGERKNFYLDPTENALLYTFYFNYD